MTANEVTENDDQKIFNPNDVTLECYEVDGTNQDFSILFPKYSKNYRELIYNWGETPVKESQLVRFFNYSKKKVNLTITEEINAFINDWKAFNTSFKKEGADGVEDTQEYKNFNQKILNTYNIPYFTDCEQLLKVYGMAFNMQQLRLDDETVNYIKTLKFRLEGWGSPLTMDEILHRYCLNLDDYFNVMSQEHTEATLMKHQLDITSQNVYQITNQIANIEEYSHRLNKQLSNHIYNKSTGIY